MSNIELFIGAMDLSAYIFLINKPNAVDTQVKLNPLPQDLLMALINESENSSSPIVYFSEFAKGMKRNNQFWTKSSGSRLQRWENGVSYGYQFVFFFGGLSHFLRLYCEIPRMQGLI